jgi:hypothetical protein
MDKSQIAKLLAKFPVKTLTTGNIRTCPARLSYPNIFEKSKSTDDGFKSTYGATLLFPKGADLTILREAAKAAAIDEFGSKGTTGLKLPFRDQAEKEGKAGYEAGAFFFRANSEMQPGILGPDGRPLTDPTALYPGCWCLATVRPFAYSNRQKGVAFGLQNIAKIADDDSFGGVPAAAADEFADVLEGAAATKEMFGAESNNYDFG